MHVIVPCATSRKKILTVIHHFLYTVPLKLKQFNTKLKINEHWLIFVIPLALVTMNLERMILK